MKKSLIPLLSLLALTACGGAPASFVPGGGTDPEIELPDGLTGTNGSGGALERYEARDGNGGGYAEDIRYDKDKDEFFVDNLAFDGANTAYKRGTAIKSIGGANGLNSGPFAVYEGPDSFPDSVTGDPIRQFEHRAIYAESRNTASNGAPRTRFAIVRTGSYSDYGFGGFVYAREGNTTFPRPNTTNSDSAQGIFTGDYAGLVDNAGRGGMLASTGEMELIIDFQDFNDGNQNGDAVRGIVSNRSFYNLDGSNATASYLTELNTQLGYSAGNGLTAIPSLLFTIEPGVTLENGEISGTVGNSVRGPDGTLISNESGTYYAVLAGDANTADSEVVGVLVVGHSLPGGITQRETGGFIVYRGAGN